MSTDDYYYDDEYYEESEPQTVIGYLFNEAVNGQQQGQNDLNELESTIDSIQDKLLVGPASLANDPVFNFILNFSMLALLIQAFYTPFGKTSVGKKRRRYVKPDWSIPVSSSHHVTIIFTIIYYLVMGT